MNDETEISHCEEKKMIDALNDLTLKTKEAEDLQSDSTLLNHVPKRNYRLQIFLPVEKTGTMNFENLINLTTTLVEDQEEIDGGGQRQEDLIDDLDSEVNITFRISIISQGSMIAPNPTWVNEMRQNAKSVGIKIRFELIILETSKSQFLMTANRENMLYRYKRVHFLPPVLIHQHNAHHADLMPDIRRLIEKYKNRVDDVLFVDAHLYTECPGRSTLKSLNDEDKYPNNKD